MANRHVHITNERGFTLIEVLTVAAMISILATVALASLHRSREAAYEAQAIGALRTLSSMEYTYLFRHRVFGSWEALRAEEDLLDIDYMKVDNLTDPFDRPIALKYSIQFIASDWDFTIIAHPQLTGKYHLRAFSVYGDGAINNAAITSP
jgi:prepilin-type N-terminal cleavage/methylation domain-containing protein